MTPRDKYAKMQSAAQSARQALRDCRVSLEVKYGEGNTRAYSKAEARQVDTLRSRVDKADAAFFSYLHSIAARDFDRGFISWWLIDNLTYDMATTTDAIPPAPPAWGYSQADMARFCGAI